MNEQYRQHLSDLLTHTRANIAILIFYSDETVIAQGKLSSSALRKLVFALHRQWSAAEQKVLIRFVGLDLDDQFLLLFAKYLPHEETLLGLAFPLETPLRTIRQEMTEVMRLLAALPEQDSVEQSLQYTGKHDTENDPAANIQPEDSGWHREINGESVIPVEPPSRNFMNMPSASDGGDSDAPTKGMTSRVEVPTKVNFQKHQPATEEIEPKNTWQVLKDLTPQSEDLVSLLQGDFDLQDNLDVAKEWDVTLAKPHQSAHDNEFENKGVPISDSQEHQSDREYRISNMTFCLFPGMVRHHFFGELPQMLNQCLEELCQIYGWQLIDISIRPDYMKWTLGDFPELLITRMLKIIRTQTSERIYHSFPDLCSDPNQPDFWAPGYMVNSKKQDFSNRAHIDQINLNHERINGSNR